MGKIPVGVCAVVDDLEIMKTTRVPLRVKGLVFSPQYCVHGY